MAFDVKYSLILQDKFTKIARKAYASLEKFERKAKSTSERMENFGRRMSGFAHRLILPVLGMTAALHEGFSAADKQTTAMALLRAELGKNNPKINEMSEATEKLEGNTRIASETSLKAMANLTAYIRMADPKHNSAMLSAKAALTALHPLADFASKQGVPLANVERMFEASLTGTNAFNRYFKIPKNLHNKALFDALIAGLKQNAKGYAKIMGSQGMGPLIKMKNQIAGIWRDIAGRLLVEIKPFVDKMTAWFRSFREFLEKHKALAKVLGNALMAIMAITSAAFTLATVMTGLSIANGLLLGNLALGAKLMFALLNPMTYIRAAMKVWTALNYALSLSFEAIAAASKMSLVLVALSAIALGMMYAYKHSAKFRKIMNDIGTTLLKLAPVIKKIGNSIDWFSDKLADGIYKLAKWLGLVKDYEAHQHDNETKAFQKRMRDPETLHEIYNMKHHIVSQVPNFISKGGSSPVNVNVNVAHGMDVTHSVGNHQQQQPLWQQFLHLPNASN